MRKLLLYFLILVFSIGFVYSAEDLTEAKKLIDAKTPCSSLDESQLEVIGNYLMEKIHPGEAHEIMDKMMGGEGSESLRLMHIAMAKRLYCNDTTANYGMMGYGMMGTGLGRGAYGGMMGTNFGYGMMENWGYGMMGQSYGYWSLINLLSLVLLVGLVILVYLWIAKLWKEVYKKAK